MFSHNNKMRYSLSLIAMLVSASLQAAPDEIMVITGTKTEKSLLDVPIRTEVISAEQLKRTHARDLAEGLENLAGLSIVPVHGKSLAKQVSIQGVDPDRVLILIDGVPVTATSGSAVDLTQIALANVKQIEVTKGALSALYGSEAMGGVVNVITALPQTPAGGSITIDGGGYGEHGLRNDYLNDRHYQVSGHVRTGGWFGQLTADHRDKGGYDADLSTYASDVAQGTQTNISLIGGYHFANGGKLKITPSLMIEDLDQQASELHPGFGLRPKAQTEEATRAGINVSYNGPLSDSSSITAYYLHEQTERDLHNYFVDLGTTDLKRESQSNIDKIEMQLDMNIGYSHLLTAGVVGFQSSLQQSKDGNSEITPNKPSRENIEFYLQDDYFITDNFELLPGIRAQYDSDFAEHYSPKLNFMYRPAALAEYALRIRGGVGTGYKVPSLKERYYVFDHSKIQADYGYMVLGNPDLKPEESISYQLGLDLQLSAYIWAEINLYRNDIKNLITEALSYSYSDDSGRLVDVTQYLNQDRTFTQGIDSSIKLIDWHNLNATLGYTYLQAEDKDTGNEIVGRPQHQAKASLTYAIPIFNSDISLLGRFEGKSYADLANSQQGPSYSIFDFKLNTYINDALKIFAGIDNFTNTKKSLNYSASDNRPIEGRFIYAGFSYQL